MTCYNCTWYVNDDVDEPDDFEHKTAQKFGCGFCLLKDLFTNVNPDDAACSDFNSDGEKK